MCHPLPVTGAVVELAPEGVDSLRITARVKTTGKTGVEMEALCAANVALLTIYDMCKAADKRMCMTDMRVLEKHGGKSGSFVA